MSFGNEPTRKQIIAMDSIVRYLPHLKNERKECNTITKASDFISKYGFASYEARSKEKGQMSVKDFLNSKGIIV